MTLSTSCRTQGPEHSQLSGVVSRLHTVTAATAFASTKSAVRAGALLPPVARHGQTPWIG